MKQQSNKEINFDNDPLLPEVTEFIRKFDFPLAGLLQRKFKIGFSRAERLIKEMRKKEVLHQQ